MLSSAEFTNVSDRAICFSTLPGETFSTCILSANSSSHSAAGTSEGPGMSHIYPRYILWNRLARLHLFSYVGAMVEGGRREELSTFYVKFLGCVF